MGLPEPRRTGYTVEDWAGWQGRWELIHGIPFDMTPAPSVEHQRVSIRLATALQNGVDERRRRGGGLCEVFHAPIDLHIPGEQSVYQPDLLVVCDPGKITARGIEGAPDLVVEILSPGTAIRDLNHKRMAYEAAGITEYLIVNPVEGIGVLLRLEDGRYVEAARVPRGTLVGLLGGALPVTLP